MAIINDMNGKARQLVKPDASYYRSQRARSDRYSRARPRSVTRADIRKRDVFL